MTSFSSVKPFKKLRVSSVSSATLANDSGSPFRSRQRRRKVFNDNTLAEKPSLFTVDGNIVENVKEFTYLGQLVTTKESACFTDLRKSRAMSKFNELRKVLCDTNVNLHTRRKLLEACVR